MASVLHAKKKVKQQTSLIPLVVGTHCRPTKIPVWTGCRSGASSEDSDEQTAKIKSSEMRQSTRASRLPVRIDIVPGSKVNANNTRDNVRPTSGSHREMKECLSINQARCNEAIEQGGKVALPGIMEKLLAQKIGKKDDALPKRKQDKPRNNDANRKTSARNILVPRPTSTTGKRVKKKSNLPTNKRQNESDYSSSSKYSLKNVKKACMSNNTINENSVKTDKYQTDSDSLIRSEPPASVPQKAQSESEELLVGKEKQTHEAVPENFAHTEPLIVPQLVQSKKDDVSDKARHSLNEYIRKYELDSDWLNEFDQDIDDLIKQGHREYDQDESDREDEAEKKVKEEEPFNTWASLKHRFKRNSDGLSQSDLENLPKLTQSKNEDVLIDADKARNSLNDFILKYESDSDWLTEFDLDVEDLIKQEHSEDDQDVADSQDKKGEGLSDGEDSLSTYSSLQHKCKTDSDVLADSDLDSFPKQVESESEEASESDKPPSDCTREYNYDADVDGLTDSEPESVPNQDQMESAFSDEEKKEGNRHVSPNSKLELSLECESDDCANSVPENLPEHFQNEVWSDEEGKVQESSFSIGLKNLECNFKAVLDDFALSNSSDPESNIKDIRSDLVDEFQEEEKVELSRSGSSIGSKLRRFSIELIETDGLFSTDSEAERVSKDAELRIISDYDNDKESTNDDEVALPSDDDKYEDNHSLEPADMTTNDNHPEDEMKRQTHQVLQLGLIVAANETNEKQEPTKCSKISGTDQMSQSRRGGEGCGAGQNQRGANSGQGSTAGGSGGDDPNDPRKPKPRKEPEDKKDRDEEKERRKAAKRALINQAMGIAGNLLQNKPAQIVTNANPVAKATALNEDKASQTKEEERVETLLKTIVSKDREIAMLQNLVDCCRKDYEDLQESFNGYIEEFTEVDQLRDLISSMYTDNSILRHDNQKLKNQLYQKTDEAAQAYDRNKKYKEKISKMEADLGSLKSAKEELSRKLKSYAAAPPCDEQKDKTGKEQTECALGKTCSLQDMEAMKVEEENQTLKRKLEQCEASLKTQKKGNTEMKEKLAKQKLAQQQLESIIQKLAEENKTLSSKYDQAQKQRCSEVSIEEIVKDLKKLHEEISEARKDLASDNLTVDKPELKGPTFSPLSIELAQADDLQHQPEVNPGTELHTLTYSLTALTEDLREQIAQSKVKMAKAYCDDDYSELKKKSNEKMRELNEEIAGLHGRLDEETEKFKDLKGLVTSSYTESDRLNEWISELQEELSNSEESLSQTIAVNDKKLNELKRALDMKDQKLEGMMVQHQDLLEANDALRGVICTLNMNGAASSSKIMELENYLGQLESEHEKLFKQLCEHKTNLHKIQRENDKRQALSSEDVEQLHYILQNKTKSLVDILDRIGTNHPGYHDHPCVSAIENGLQLVYDVTGLLRAVGQVCISRKDLCEPLIEETRERELEIMVENLQEENTKLHEDMLRLENLLKGSKAKYLDDDNKENGKEQTREVRLREELMNEELNDMQGNLVRKSSSEIINELEKYLRHRQDSEIELQQRANTLQLQIEQLKAEKREADRKDQELKSSIEVKQRNLAEQQLKEEQNMKLVEKLSCMETVISALQKEKQYAEQKADGEIRLIRQESREKVTALEKSLEERSDSATKLEDKVRSLEAGISQLNAEKAEREENIKTMCEALNARKNLEEQLRENEDVEKQFVKTAEDLKLKIFRLRAAKKTLRSELAKEHLQNRTNSTATRNQLLKLKTELAECTEREKELNDRIRKLTEERDKAESMMEAQVTLIQKSSKEKMEDLEKLLRTKSHSELELQEQKTCLEQELMRLEKERSEHTRIISAILRAVKAKQELAKAVSDRCKTEKDYKCKLDEIESVIKKLKAEKNKPNCDMALKETYKEKYFELRRIIRELEEDVHSQNKRVEELQTVVLAAVEDEDKSEQIRESNLQRSIETLKDTLKDSHTCEVKLYKTLQSLNSKILVLENEKAEGEKMMKDLLKSMGGREALDQGPTASKTGTDKAFLKLLGQVIDGVHRLRQVKQRVEEDVVNFENMIATARSETEVLQNQSFERISGLEQSLQEKYISETELQERLKSMDKKVADLESEKQSADMAIQAMLGSLKSKDELEKLLKQKDVIEKELKQKVLGLEQEKKQNETQVKFLQRQVHDLEEFLQQKTTDVSNDLAQQIHVLNTNLSTVANDSEEEKSQKVFKVQFDTMSDGAPWSCLHKIKEVTQQLQQQNHLEEELRQVIDSLTKEKKELQEEKKASIEENRNVVRCLNDLKIELEAANRDKQKLSVEVEELKCDNLSSARNSRKLIEELTKREKELVKEINERKAAIRTSEEHTNYSPGDDDKSLNQEMKELKIKIAELENKNYEHSAKNKKHQHEQFSESKKAKAKIQDLNLHLQQRMQFEDHLKNSIKVLNEQVSEMSVQIRNEKMKNVEIEKSYVMSKYRITELEDSIACKQEQIDNLRKSSEELRGQVVRLHEEKDNFASTLEESYHLRLEQQDMQIKQLKNKLEDQEEKARESTRRQDDMTQYRGQMFMTTRGESSGLRTNEDQRNTTKVIIDSLNDTERRIGKLKSSWKHFEELQNRSPLNTSIDSILTRNNTTIYNSSHYRPLN